MVFSDRKQAGQLLSKKLSDYSNRKDVVVLAIPRGGVVVGYEIARELKVALNVVVTKKIGAPGNEELAIGAVAEDGEPIFDEQLVGQLQVDEDYRSAATARVHRKIVDYIQKFRGGRALDVAGKVVIVTDDGVATGSTMEAALSWLREKKTAEIVLAVPIGARDSTTRLEKFADRSVVLDKPFWFGAVGQFYREFGQVDDNEVKKILLESRRKSLPNGPLR
ncbi:phosphoribosyltransferase [Patescibacteria group bacterium]|nr:phosphoribosyltransferase [Patescibacteria group bacterium]